MEIGADREDRDNVTPGSAPLSSALEASPNTPFLPLQFDAGEFMQFVEDEDLTEEEAAALLRTIWDHFVIPFVDLWFGIHPVQQVVDGFPVRSDEALQAESTTVLSSKSLSHKPKEETVGRNRRRTAAKEDS